VTEYSNIERFRVKIVDVEKQELLHTLCVCVCVALLIQHAMHMRRNIMCGLPRSTTAWFPEKKVTEHKMCVLIFSTLLSETFLILRRNQ
jgi:hypothetical protein